MTTCKECPVTAFLTQRQWSKMFAEWGFIYATCAVHLPATCAVHLCFLKCQPLHFLKDLNPGILGCCRSKFAGSSLIDSVLTMIVIDDLQSRDQMLQDLQWSDEVERVLQCFELPGQGIP